MLVLDPIFRIFGIIMDFKKEETATLLQKSEISLAIDEKDSEDMGLFRVVIPKFLPAGSALLEMICINLPSPVDVQAYRCAQLYEGTADDECAVSIRNCDHNGPLLLRRGQVFSEEQKPGTPMMTLKVYLPVNEPFGFTATTGGQAFLQAVVDHWQPMDGNHLGPGNKVYDIICAACKRKSVVEDISDIDKYYDQL